MTVFHHQRLNRTRATSSWSDELSMIEFAGVSGSGHFFPTASRGPFDFCSQYAQTLVCRFFGQLHHQLEQKHGQMLSRNLPEAPNTQIVAIHCDPIGRDAGGRKRFEHTLASRSFLARRSQLNQGALPTVEF